MLSDNEIKEIISISQKSIEKNCTGFNFTVDIDRLPHAIAIAEAIRKYDELK